MIQINARQQKLKFDKNSEGTYMYVMHVNQYSNLNAKKVIEEASAHSGIGKGALKGAWDAIGDVIRSWVTEGHSVTIPGLGTVRFSVQAKAVEDVNDVAKKLITSRKVVFTPDSDILATLRGTSVQITCIDKDGNVVKRVTDDASNETVEEGGSGEGQNGSNGSNSSSGSSENGGSQNGGGSQGGGTGTIDTGGNGGNTGGNGGSTDPDDGDEG